MYNVNNVVTMCRYKRICRPYPSLPTAQVHELRGPERCVMFLLRSNIDTIVPNDLNRHDRSYLTSPACECKLHSLAGQWRSCSAPIYRAVHLMTLNASPRPPCFLHMVLLFWPIRCVRTQTLLKNIFYIYCIAGKFCGELNLAVWRSTFAITKLKSANVSYLHTV